MMLCVRQGVQSGIHLLLCGFWDVLIDLGIACRVLSGCNVLLCAFYGGFEQFKFYYNTAVYVFLLVLSCCMQQLWCSFLSGFGLQLCCWSVLGGFSAMLCAEWLIYEISMKPITRPAFSEQQCFDHVQCSTQCGRVQGTDCSGGGAVQGVSHGGKPVAEVSLTHEKQSTKEGAPAY